jgi:hypothetical protein
VAPVCSSVDPIMAMTGVFPLPAAKNSCWSAVSDRVNVPSGTNTRSTDQAETLLHVQFDAWPSRTRLT